MKGEHARRVPITPWTRVFAASLYALASVLIMISNKLVLTTWKFPSGKCLALGQFVFTSLLLLLLSLGKRLVIRPFSREIARRLAPITVLFVGNVVAGLAGTKALNLAMFSALRRVSIMMTLLLEWLVVGAKPTGVTAVAVLVMLLGAFVAAVDDLAFDVGAYTMVLLNNICTAGNGVFIKRGLTGPCRLSKFELLYYQSLGAIPILALVLWTRPAEVADVVSFPFWRDSGFLACFASSCVMGLILNWAAAFCTQVNSALTTTVVGCLKNVLTAYLAIAGFGGDYVFSRANFIGLNLSILGSLVYSLGKLRPRGGGGGGRGDGGQHRVPSAARSESVEQRSGSSTFIQISQQQQRTV